MHISSLALTHPGLRRESNEDCFAARPNLGFWIVCDGMGGHAAGEVASRVAADTIEGFIDATDRVGDKSYTWPFGFMPELGVDGTRLVTAFRLANRAIDVRTTDEPALRGMATTAVALLLQGGSVRSPGPSGPGNQVESAALALPVRSPVPLGPGNAGDSPTPDEPAILRGLVAHVGDSRAYLWREGILTRLTTDHSWVEEQIRQGTLTEADARTHPWRNLVTRALSGGPDPDVAITPVALEPGDRVLLCSDGLTSAVTDDVVGRVLGNCPRGDVEAACQRLIDAANAAGGPDNITVAIIELA
jgi:PPM family protein phosphatase